MDRKKLRAAGTYFRAAAMLEARRVIDADEPRKLRIRAFAKYVHAMASREYLDLYKRCESMVHYSDNARTGSMKRALMKEAEELHDSMLDTKDLIETACTVQMKYKENKPAYHW